MRRWGGPPCWGRRRCWAPAWASPATPPRCARCLAARCGASRRRPSWQRCAPTRRWRGGRRCVCRCWAAGRLPFCRCLTAWTAAPQRSRRQRERKDHVSAAWLAHSPRYGHSSAAPDGLALPARLPAWLQAIEAVQAVLLHGTAQDNLDCPAGTLGSFGGGSMPKACRTSGGHGGQLQIYVDARSLVCSESGEVLAVPAAEATEAAAMMAAADGGGAPGQSGLSRGQTVKAS